MMFDHDHAMEAELCSALRAWRIRSRLRQDAIAKCLGVAQSQISRWESGRDLPRPHNIEAIRRLVWGPEADPLLALRHFVTNSIQHLLLLDDHQEILARSIPYQASPNPLDRFGWVLDPVHNPAFAPVYRRYLELLQSPGGVIGMSITLPFEHDGQAWSAVLGNTIHSIAGVRVCLAELTFGPTAGQDRDVRVEEVRLDSLGETRHSTKLWHQPSR
ncbi:MAG: helix-turn-helix transcriptional regulator [Devosia sp.]|uniref:helix-turn-helix domain-containing protein n=1 Tax=Devosia sp. TaxID=1871048 RepID=UPI002634CF33|nr:helix-turn-helix domain-containing protein [Devosia sp.]MDB5585454.1 helix-turn-helix transcriptional regulator [Devosia sp.]